MLYQKCFFDERIMGKKYGAAIAIEKGTAALGVDREVTGWR
jgi:hypothetical protein